MLRLTRDVLRSWFPKNGVFSKLQLESVLQIIIQEFHRDFCLQEILDVSFKVYMEDITHYNIYYPFYSLFTEIANRLNLNLYELTEQCVIYSMPDFYHVRSKYDRLQITISKVVRFYGDHVDRGFLEKILYDTCKKELYFFSPTTYKNDFDVIFKSTVDFFLN